MDIIKHSAAAGNFILVRMRRRFALLIIYARERDGRPPQYESIPTTAERSGSELGRPRAPWWGFSHCQPAVTIGWRTATARPRLDGRAWQTSSSLISDQSSRVAASQWLAGTPILSQSGERFPGTKFILCLIIHLLSSFVLSGGKADGNLFLMWNFIPDFTEVMDWLPVASVSIGFTSSAGHSSVEPA